MAYQYQQDSYGYPPVVGGAYNEAGADSGGVPLGSDVYGIGVGVGVAGAVPSGNDSMSGSSGEEDTSRGSGGDSSATSFEDPRVADLPRILLMGPRRGGKTSIQRVVFHKMSPHETLFRLEATQALERFVVDHTPLCRFTIWDFPGDYYGSGPTMGGRVGSSGTSTPHSQSPGGYYADGSPLMGPAGGVPVDMYGQPVLLAPQQFLQPAHAGLGGESAMGPGGEAEDNGAGGINDDDAYVFGRATALIFVLDAQDEPYDHVLQNFTETVTRAIRANPHIAIEVFINKVDGELFLSDEAKYDCRRDVMQQVSDELGDAGVPPDSVPISYHLTSIYDHSVFEAFSRVVQKLIPQLPTLENLLNVLVSTCAMEKAYLFDVASKLYISTDSSPVDMQSVELCSDMIDVVLDVSGIYGLRGKDQDGAASVLENGGGGETASLTTPAATAPLTIRTATTTTGDLDSLETGPVGAGEERAGDSSNPVEVDGEPVNAIAEQQSFITGDSVAVDSSAKAGAVGSEVNDELVGTLISQNFGMAATEEGKDEKERGPDSDSAYDSESASVIRLSNGMVLYLKEVDAMLALVCLTREHNFRKKSLINYNIGCLKKALRALVPPASDTIAEG